MAKAALEAQLFYSQGTNLTGDVGAINSAGSPRGVQPVTGLDKVAMERILLRSDGDMEWASFFNPTTARAHDVLGALPTSDVVLLWAWGGAIGDVAAGMVAKQIDYQLTKGADGSVSAVVPARANGTPLEWLVMLTAGEELNASAGNGSAVDSGASATTDQGMTAYLEIVDIASGTPTVTIEDSANGSTGWATVLSFTAVADGAEPTGERVAVTGTVERYLRVARTGTFADLDYLVAVRRGESYDDVDGS